MNEEILIDRVQEELERPIDEKVPLPKITELPNSFVEITESLRHISGRWSPVEIFTASKKSRSQEKDKLFQSYKKKEEYNPVFEYDDVENFNMEDSAERLRKLLQRVRSFIPSNQEERLAKIAIYYKIKDDIATTELVNGIKEKDDARVGEAMKQKYPGTNEVLLNKAQEIYEEMCGPTKLSEKSEAMLSNKEQEYLSSTQVDAEGIKEAFVWALAQYGMLDIGNGEGFRVEVSDKVTSTDVRDKASEGPTVYIPKNKKITLDKLIGLMAHEIEGHARQSVNGRKLFLIGGGDLMGDNDMLYEGLGMRYETKIIEKFFGKKTSQPLPFYTFAIRDAEQGRSFYQIFSNQVERRLHVNLKINPVEEIDHSRISAENLNKAMDSAWLTTYRIMRGHLDTSNPNSYANSKDLAYLRGWMLDQRLIKIHAGYLNEAATIHYKALKLIARFDLTEDDLAIPFKDITTDYWEKVLKPQM